MKITDYIIDGYILQEYSKWEKKKDIHPIVFNSVEQSTAYYAELGKRKEK